MMKKVLILLFACFLIAMASVAQATRIYVSDTGSASNPGTRLSPCRSLRDVMMDNNKVSPGDTVVILGVYHHGPTSDDYIVRAVRGTKDNYIYLMGDPEAPALSSSMNGEGVQSITLFTSSLSSPSPCDVAHESDTEWLWIENLVIENVGDICTASLYAATGLSFDDGGSDCQSDTPLNNLVIKDCLFRDIGCRYDGFHRGGSGIKFAGVDTFLVEGCTFENIYRQGIDAVGAHAGIIRDCTFQDFISLPGWTCDDTGHGMVWKGASSDITIERCLFKNLSGIGVYVGNTTTESLYRPPFGHHAAKPAGSKVWLYNPSYPLINYENKDTRIYSSIFINVGKPFAFIGAIDTKIYNNTIFCPKISPEHDGIHNQCDDGGTYSAFWYGRTAVSSQECGVTLMDSWPTTGGEETLLLDADNIDIQNNLIVVGHTQSSSTGSYPSPIYASIPSDQGCIAWYTHELDFKNNLWHCLVNPTWSEPNWSWCGVSHTGENYIGDPLFDIVSADTSMAVDFKLSALSPAKNKGVDLTSYAPTDFWGDPYGAMGHFEIGAAAYGEIFPDSLFITKPDNHILDWGTYVIGSGIVAKTVRYLNHTDAEISGTVYVSKNYFKLNDTHTSLDFFIDPGDAYEFTVSFDPRDRGVSYSCSVFNTSYFPFVSCKGSSAGGTLPRSKLTGLKPMMTSYETDEVRGYGGNISGGETGSANSALVPSKAILLCEDVLMSGFAVQTITATSAALHFHTSEYSIAGFRYHETGNNPWIYRRDPEESTQHTIAISELTGATTYVAQFNTKYMTCDSTIFSDSTQFETLDDCLTITPSAFATKAITTTGATLTFNSDIAAHAHFRIKPYGGSWTYHLDDTDSIGHSHAITGLTANYTRYQWAALPYLACTADTTTGAYATVTDFYTTCAAITATVIAVCYDAEGNNGSVDNSINFSTNRSCKTQLRWRYAAESYTELTAEPAALTDHYKYLTHAIHATTDIDIQWRYLDECGNWSSYADLSINQASNASGHLVEACGDV